MNRDLPDSSALEEFSAANLSPNKQRALATLLASPSVAAAAEKCSLAERTVRGYLKDPVFAAIYRSERARLFEESIGGLQAASASAIEALVEVLTDRNLEPEARVRTAKVVLDFMLRGVEQERRIRELEELLARVAALEKAREELERLEAW
jgi:hypothetical protein